MRYLSICSGIEAATVAWHPLGWSPVGFAEIEAFPSAVLAERYGSNMPGEPLASNGVPNHGDFTTLIDAPPDCDLLVGGTPCQAFSIAGQRRSLEDERGNLTLQFVRLAHAIRSLRWVVWENVPGVLSTEDNAFGCFLGGLVGADDALIPCDPPPRGKSNAYWRWRAAGRWPVLDDDGVETGEFVERAEGHVIRWPDVGMVAGPRARLAWRVLDAQHFGLAQRRRRVFVVASPGGGGDPAAVLFEPRGLRGDSASGGEAREVVAALTANGVGTCGADDNQGQAGHLIASTGRLSHCLNAGGMGRQDFETETLIAHTLRGEGFDASEDGTGRGTPLVPVYAIQERAVCENPDAGPQGAGFREGVAYTLEARHHVQAIAFPANLSGTQCASTEDVSPALGAKNPTAVAFALRGRDGGAQVEVSGEKTGPLRAANGGSSRDYVAFAENQRNELRELERAGSLSSIRRGDAKNETLLAFNSKDHGAAAGSISPTLRAGGHASSHANAGVPPAVAGAGSVRRLTPRECERLQGFPDDYTAIPWRGKPADVCPDGPRYKALGNSMAVPVMHWIGERIQQYELDMRHDG